MVILTFLSEFLLDCCNFGIVGLPVVKRIVETRNTVQSNSLLKFILKAKKGEVL